MMRGVWQRHLSNVGATQSGRLVQGLAASPESAGPTVHFRPHTYLFSFFSPQSGQSTDV